jgi:hypothetical protein
MHVLNIHERQFAAPPPEVGALMDGLGSPSDCLWPPRWPRMRFNRPLAFGASGGHGPIRYDIELYEPGKRIRFRLRSPRGFDGFHGFEVLANESGTTLRHTLEMNVHGSARVTWPLIFAPLHDALVEDCLDAAAIALHEQPRSRPWSGRVRFLRFALRLLRV